MLNIFLIRHGETDFNKEGRIQGSVDTELNPYGIEQSIKAGIFLSKHIQYFDYCFVSPQKRAIQSAEYILKNIPKKKWFIDENLREINCGRWEGKLIKDIEKEEPEVLYKIRTEVDFPYPEGESILDVKKRIDRFINNALLPLMNSTEEKNILIVSHGNLLRTFTSILLGLPLDFSIKIVLYNTGISLLKERFLLEQSFFKLIYWNQLEHLNY